MSSPYPQRDPDPQLTPAPPKKPMGKGKKIAMGVGGGVVLLIVIGSLSPKGDDGKDDNKAETAKSVRTATGLPTPATTPSAQPATKPDKQPTLAAPAANPLPDLIGIGLQSAQDQAQAAGFYNLASHDATGQGRYQVLDRNWKVCFQTPRAGQVPSGAKIEFGAVKTDESCPSTDLNPAGAETGGSLPDFTGKSVQAARRALDTSASITAEDVSGRDRAVLMESHWKICSQTPAAASRWNGQPITFKVVKTAENCP